MRSVLLLVFLSNLALANAEAPLAPFPVFLKAGYSSILEFPDHPTRVVLGDSQSFQIERLDQSIVIKTLAPYASTNMFVYFKDAPTRLFVLTASEDAQPTYYKKFESPVAPETQIPKTPLPRKPSRESRIKRAVFDEKKDYLEVETEIAADSSGLIRPNWPLVRLRHGSRILAPIQLWSERKDVQRESSVSCRFIFAKPNVNRSLEGVYLIIPLEGSSRVISLPLKG